MLCEFYLAEVVSRTRAPNPAARAPFAAEAADALEAFLRRCEVHDLLTPEAKRQREGLKRGPGAQNADPGTARADKVARFRRERAIRARLEELDATRRRRAEEALLNADWDDEDPDASPEDEVEERERWTLLIEDAVAKSLDNLDHLARELEMIAARDELAAARPARAGGVNAMAGPAGRGVYTLMPDGAVVPGFHDASNGGDASSIGSASSIGGQPTGHTQTASVPPELMESLRRMYGTGVAGGSARSAERIRSEVFRPSHILPTMTVEQAGEIEHREMMERQRTQAENAARRARDESEMTQEEREERDLAKARSWDEFKDDNPFGHGNSKLRPCS